MLKTNWIWIPDWNQEDKKEPRIVYLRKELELEEIPGELEIRISADSRYKLYVNGQLAEIGPSRGDSQIWYYDTVNLLPYLKKGKNVLAVVVLRYPLEPAKGNSGIFRTDTPGLYFWGEYVDAKGSTVCLSADKSWKCKREPEIKILPEDNGLAPLYYMEEAGGDPDTAGWMEEGYSDEDWQPAEDLGWEIIRKKAESPANLHARTIPYMKKVPGKFVGIQKIRTSGSGEAEWNRMLEGKGTITISSNSVEIVEINAGELMTGFLKLSLIGGKDAKIRILQSESYYIREQTEESEALVFQKRDRLDDKNGKLIGMTDTYKAAGYGKRGAAEVYEPFWFRTFRFIQLEVTTAGEPLCIESFDYQETGYPLEMKSRVKTSDETMQQIWDISERSLRRCMHETYIDCPFYEQLQYAMDARSQILYTYAVSADDRLARKCFDDFRRSQRYDGMISCCYPNVSSSVIPGFSIYYIMMLYDHMMYFGDKKLIRSYLPIIDRILDYFHSHRTLEGMVDKIGGILFRDKFWSFIDWTEQWNATSGVPAATLSGSVTMESLLYIMGLQYAAKISAFAGRKETAGEYLERARKVQEAVRNACTGKNGMLQDGPGIEEYSQHCQVFAILTDTVSPEQGKKNLQETMQNKQEYAQCSVAMAFYLFRALEKSGLYEYTNQLWDIWREMIKNHLTTCVEEPVTQRSDCHGWGALALYELPAVILGVRPTKPGFEEYEVKPMAGHFTWAEGEVITPKGMVKVRWKKKDGTMDIQYQEEQFKTLQ